MQAKANQISPPSPSHSALKISPDTIRINGDQLTAFGETDNGVKVVVHYRFKQENEQHFFAKLTNPINITYEGETSPVTHTTNFGNFDYGQYLKEQKQIHYQIEIKTVKKINQLSASWSDFIPVLRRRVLLYLDQLPKRVSYHAKSLLVGESDPNFAADKQLLSVLGLIHLFSISGLHVYVLISAIRKLLRVFKISRETSNLILLIVLPFFTLFVGAASSTQRACGYVLSRLIAKKLKIKLSSLDVLMLLLGINLVINPYLLHSLGGILTYLLAGAIIFTQKFSNLKRNICLHLISLPIILHFIYEWHLLSILLNMIVVPFFCWTILPLTIIAALFGVWLPWLANAIEQFFNLFYFCLEKVAQIPMMRIIFGELPIFAMVLLLFISILYLGHGKKKYLYGYGLILSLGFCWIRFPVSGRVVMVDIGQGDSILIQTPFNQSTVLIDTGGKLAFKQPKKWQEKRESPHVAAATLNYLKSQGISHLDAVILSHQDADHIGDLPYFLSNISVKQLIYPSGMIRNEHFFAKIKPFVNQLKLAGKKLPDTIDFPGLHFQVVHPVKDGLGDNQDSLTLWTKIGDKRWLFTGDLDREGELDIIHRMLLKVDILKVGHHGSHSSSDPEFIKAIQPELALISAGRHNRYGHPHRDVLETLDKNHVKHLTTAQTGMIIWQYSSFAPAKIMTYIKE